MCGYDPFCPGKTARNLTPEERKAARPLHRTSRLAKLGAWQICDTCRGVFCDGMLRDPPFPLLIRRGNLDRATGALHPPRDS